MRAEGVLLLAAGAFLALSTSWIAWALARLVLPEGRVLDRAAAALVGAAATLYLLLHALLAVGLFRTIPALVALAALAIVLWATLQRRGVRPFGEIESDLRALAGAIGGFSPVLLGAALLLGGVRVARGLVLPPLAWDALVYHLFKAGRWVALGTHHVEEAPGAWGFYEWFPSAGSVPSAWAFLAARDGALLAVAGGAVWISAAFAAGFLARRLGASREGAVAAACATATIPALAGAVTASYADTALLALFLLGAAFLATPTPRTALVAGGAWGLAGAVKVSLLPAFPLGLVALAIAGRPRGRSLLAFAAGGFPVLAIEYARAWVVKGSPFWPFPVTLFGRTLVPGDDELAKQFAGFYAEDVIARIGRLEFLEWLFLWKRLPGSDFAGFGPLSAVLAAFGLLALVAAFRKGGAGFAAALLAAGAVVLAALSPENVAQRTVWVGVLGRHLAPAFVLLVAAAATLRFAALRSVWLAAIGSAWFFAWPRGWGETDVAALAALFLPAAFGVVLGLLAGWLAFRGTRSGAAALGAGALALTIPVAMVLPGIRAETRWAAWNETLGGDPLYDLHFLDPSASSAWPAWKRLDGGGHRIAVTAGYAIEGQAWYLYPLLGSSLGNRVFYVPPTAEGTTGRMDRERFLARLVEEDVDFVMALWPPSLEREMWMASDPATFPVEIENREAGWALHRFVREGRGR
jgi:hypothetical protein